MLPYDRPLIPNLQLLQGQHRLRLQQSSLHPPREKDVSRLLGFHRAGQGEEHSLPGGGMRREGVYLMEGVIPSKNEKTNTTPTLNWLKSSLPTTFQSKSVFEQGTRPNTPHL